MSLEDDIEAIAKVLKYEPPTTMVLNAKEALPRIKAAIALNDGPPSQFPRQPTDGLGWTISVDFMHKLGDSMEPDYRPGLEEIENVLLGIEKLRSEEVERRIKEAGK